MYPQYTGNALTKERVVSIAMIGHWAIYREAGLTDNGNSHLSNFSKNRPKHGSVMSADPDGIYSCAARL